MPNRLVRQKLLELRLNLRTRTGKALEAGVYDALGVIAAIVIPALGDVALILGIPFLLLMLMGFWYGIKISFFRGTIGPNRYGPDPLATWQ